MGFLLVVAAAVASLTAATAGPTLHFSGNGSKSLKAFRLGSASTLSWTNSGPSFQVVNALASNNGTVNSQRHRGTTYYPPDRYKLQVNALGSWTITIRPGLPRLGNPIKFSGNGSQALPPFKVTGTKTMFWTNDGATFQTFPAGKSTTTGGFVSSKARSGTSKLPAGRYTLFVFAEGNWTIVIR